MQCKREGTNVERIRQHSRCDRPRVRGRPISHSVGQRGPAQPQKAPPAGGGGGGRDAVEGRRWKGGGGGEGAGGLGWAEGGLA